MLPNDTSTHYEIERKYLVVGDYKHLAMSSSEIEQGYFDTKPGITVRVRQRDRQAYLTIKGPSDESGIARYEFETKVSEADGRQLMSLCSKGRVCKTRWLVDYHGHTFEVDEFHGDNQGLVIAEVELGSAEEHVELPPFVGAEVTGDRRFYNSHLMRMPFVVWRNSFYKEHPEYFATQNQI